MGQQKGYFFSIGEYSGMFEGRGKGTQGERLIIWWQDGITMGKIAVSKGWKQAGR